MGFLEEKSIGGWIDPFVGVGPVKSCWLKVVLGWGGKREIGKGLESLGKRRKRDKGEMGEKTRLGILI
ncbi:Uncharacterized protein TCM_012910 [Theobroma cacao]|uniref:Uncharacterized protein n=1 Tax=Theobroma cacao TaxID=3641 RepID=A0A061FVW1_THECC|nr:Uncharacterized protein TCM_012910 [Theobroma cacao]